MTEILQNEICVIDEEKPLSHYDKYYKNYYNEQKEQRKLTMQKYYKNKRDNVLAKNTEWNNEHKEVMNTYAKNYYIDHKDELLIKAKQRREKQKEDLKLFKELKLLIKIK